MAGRGGNRTLQATRLAGGAGGRAGGEEYEPSVVRDVDTNATHNTSKPLSYRVAEGGRPLRDRAVGLPVATTGDYGDGRRADYGFSGGRVVERLACFRKDGDCEACPE